MEEAQYRPMGLAQGPDGSLYISESKKGKIWRIIFSGDREGYEKENLASMSERLKKSNIKQPTEKVDILN
jgi:sugar lactone lactonase YvrE